jgi:hypothetical protein
VFWFSVKIRWRLGLRSAQTAERGAKLIGNTSAAAARSVSVVRVFLKREMPPFGRRFSRHEEVREYDELDRADSVVVVMVLIWTSGMCGLDATIPRTIC